MIDPPPAPPRSEARRSRAATLAAVGLVFLLALWLRLDFVGPEPRSTVAYDEVLYDGLARSILAGRGFAIDGVETAIPDAYRSGPTAVMAPVYPLFMAAVYALTGPDPAHIRAIQPWIGAGACVLVYLLALALAGPGRRGKAAALLAGLLAASSRVLVGWTDLLLSENLVVPLVLGTLLLVLRPPRGRAALGAAAAGLTLGLAVQTRSELVLMLPLILLWMLAAWRWRVDSPWRPRHAATLALAFALCLLPWTLRNWARLGGFTFVRSFSGPALYIAYNDHLRSVGAMVEGATPELDPGVADLPPGDELAFDRHLRGVARSYALAHPRRVLRAASLKTLTFWRPVPRPWWPAGQPLSVLLPPLAAFWLAVLGLGALLWRSPWAGALALGALASQAVVVALVGAWERERFRTPVYGLELALIAIGVVTVVAFVATLPGRLRAERSSTLMTRRGAVAAALILAAILAFAHLATRGGEVVAFNPLDGPGDLAAFTRLQGSEATVAIDAAAPARGSGSLRLTSAPEAGWQDIQLTLPPGSLRENAIYRVTYAGRTDGRVGGQVYALIPAGGEDRPLSTGLARHVFRDAVWRDESFFFVAPFDGADPVAIYLSHEDYQVPGASVWVDDLTVRESGWARLAWEGYVTGRW